MTTITINNREVKLPESWNGLTLEQVLACYTIIMQDSFSVYEAQEVMPFKRINLIQYLLGLDNKFMKDWESDCKDAYGEDGELVFLSEMNEVFKTVDFLFQEQEEEQPGEKMVAIKLGLTKCPYPEIVYTSKKGKKRKRYFAPADGLENIDFNEMCQSFTCFEQYLETKEEHWIDELIATIYRPQKPATKENKRSDYHGDIRMPLLNHESMVKKRIIRNKDIPAIIKQVTVFWFASCRQKIIDENPEVFSVPGGGDPSMFGWGGILMALATDITKVDEVGSKPASDVLTYIHWTEERRKEIERQQKKAQRAARMA